MQQAFNIVMLLWISAIKSCLFETATKSWIYKWYTMHLWNSGTEFMHFWKPWWFALLVLCYHSHLVDECPEWPLYGFSTQNFMYNGSVGASHRKHLPLDGGSVVFTLKVSKLLPDTAEHCVAFPHNKLKASLWGAAIDMNVQVRSFC